MWAQKWDAELAAVVFDKVRKAFGSVIAVDDLDLVIESGEFVSILGPSGCGKTTTLRMLAGLDYPTGGTIEIDGRVVNEVAPGTRDIAMVFQSYALYPHMSVAGNIEYPLKKRRMPSAQRKAKVAEVAEILQLGELLGRKPRQLSGGQQQRVALGRALVRDPKVFLLDEPLSNLDAKLRAHMRAELIELHQRIGGTMVYVTHDQLEAMTMSNRIAIMREGKLQQFASPAEVYKRPINAFVAGFIGTPPMNFVDGEITAGDGSTNFKSGQWRIEMPGGHLTSEGNRNVRIGIRPEDLSIAADGTPATVKVVELTGPEAIVLFDVHGNTIVARITAEESLRPGDKVNLRSRPDRIHVFDAGTGERLNADIQGADT